MYKLNFQGFKVNFVLPKEKKVSIIFLLTQNFIITFFHFIKMNVSHQVFIKFYRDIDLLNN